MPIGLLTIDIFLPGCSSLKEKRRRLKPLLKRLHREFNISVAEMDFQDSWQSARIGCTILSNDFNHTQQSLERVLHWLETHWRDVQIDGEKFEYF
jgi:uncharacterized protein YlxP (DUF503 family)